MRLTSFCMCYSFYEFMSTDNAGVKCQECMRSWPISLGYDDDGWRGGVGGGSSSHHFLPRRFIAAVHCGQNHFPFGAWVSPTQP